jgi:UDP-N-acetylmuramoyl-L-alanyl-D-glutamate--2,6-diaminopimelate ligase
MLSKLTLATILGLPIESLAECADQFLHIDWKTQASTLETILFYKIGQKETDEDLFWERIQSTSYGLLILNTKPKKQNISKSIVIAEENWPELQKKILDFFFPVPKDLKMIAVTGTNGKTTTTDLILQLGEQCGKKGLSLGTLGVRENGKTLEDFGLTSPSLIDLRKYIYRFGQHKDFCVMEVSSHALSQRRIFGLEFSVAGWPSFSQDHLDYHQTMESYF